MASYAALPMKTHHEQFLAARDGSGSAANRSGGVGGGGHGAPRSGVRSPAKDDYNGNHQSDDNDPVPCGKRRQATELTG